MNNLRASKPDRQDASQGQNSAEDYPVGPYQIGVQVEFPAGATVAKIVDALQAAYNEGARGLDEGVRGHFQVLDEPSGPGHSAGIIFKRENASDAEVLRERFGHTPFATAAPAQLADEFQNYGGDDAITKAVIRALREQGRVIFTPAEAEPLPTAEPTGLRRESFTILPPSLSPERVTALAKKYLEQDGPRPNETMQQMADALVAHLGGSLRTVNQIHMELDAYHDKLEESNRDRKNTEEFLCGFQNALEVVRKHHAELGDDLINLISGR